MSIQPGSPDTTTARRSARIWQSDHQVDVPSMDIVSFIFANLANYDANKPIYVNAYDASDSISAKDARITVSKLIKGFKEIGLAAGECVCLHSYNNIQYPLLWLGVIGAGGCVTGTNPAHTSSELVHHFKNTSPKYIVAQSECLGAIEEAAEYCQIPKSHIFTISNHNQKLSKSYPSWDSLLVFGEVDWDIVRKDEEDPSNYYKPAVYAATSGTTGLPKAAMISHCSLVAQASMIEKSFACRTYEPSQLISLPIFHAFAAPIALLLPLRLGLPTYFMPRFKLDSFIRIVKTLKITDTAVVPPIVTALSALDVGDASQLASLRYVICAGAPISADVQSKLYDVLSPSAVISQCWGATELGWVTLFNHEEKDTSGSVGRLMPNVELKIVGENGESVTRDDVPGEAYVRSASTFLGYLNNTEATASAIDDTGFYRTGDRVFIRNDKIFIDGRIKDIIKVNGWQVSPAEIEHVLLQHPKIADAAVIGVRTAGFGGLEETRPRAYVVPRENLSVQQESWRYLTPPDSPILNALEVLTENEIRDFVASKLVSYKQLSGGVRFVTKIPRNPTGKILRRLLPDC